MIFTAVNAACFRLAPQIGANRALAALATLACAAALCALLVHTYEETPRALAVFASLLAFAIAFELVYRRVSGRRFASLQREHSAD